MPSISYQSGQHLHTVLEDAKQKLAQLHAKAERSRGWSAFVDRELREKIRQADIDVSKARSAWERAKE